MAWESTSPGRPFGGFVDATATTAARIYRTSLQVAALGDSDARIYRTSLQIARLGDPDLRVYRTSMQVAVTVGTASDGGWGVIPIG